MNTLFDKIWDKHVVQIVDDGPTQLYIDRLYCHEVTSPQAFSGMRERGLKCFRPQQIFCMPDHNTPTHDQDKPIVDPVSKKQVDLLARNCEDFGPDRIFPITKSYLHREMDRGSKAAGVKRIRVHDLRHSHVSLLIDMGFTPVAIADRLGHESIEITLRYAHLFPSKQTEMIEKLEHERME